MKKSNKGFTLVELIVVIAIIGILAAILVPAMIGYIADSKLSSANSSAKTVYTAAMAGCQKLVNKGTPINSTATGYTLNLANAGKDEAPTTADYDSSVTTAGAPKSAEDFLQKAVCSSLNVDAANSVARVLIGDKGFPVEVCWAKNENDKYVGAYPNAKEKADGVISTYSWTVSISAAPAASSSSSAP